MLFKYIAWHYLKNMLIILLGLSGLFAGLDFLMNGSSLPSFNIKVLYAFNKWQEALNLLYPLAIIFGAIWTTISFIKQNTLGALYALGVTRRELIKPFLTVATGTYLMFVGLNFTSFATAQDTAWMLKQNRYAQSQTEDLFFKYNNSFVYIGTLIPREYRIKELTIFELKEGKVIETFTAKEAWYNIFEWVAIDVIKKTKVLDALGNQRLKVEHIEVLHTLTNYQPEILKSIYDGESLTLYGSIMAKKLLASQGVSTYQIRANIYNKTIMPLFSIALLMILLFRFPFHARYMNIAGTTVQALGGTLFIWGILFALNRIGQSGTITPELALILPMTLLWTYAFYALSQANKHI
jgi:lipopolysaccharide export system permease protein